MQKAFPPLLMYFIRVGYDTGVLSRTCAMVGDKTWAQKPFSIRRVLALLGLKNPNSLALVEQSRSL